MTAQSITTDLADITLMEAGTTTTSVGSGAGAGDETDFFIQGVACQSRKISGNNGAPEGFLATNPGGAITFTDEHVYAWIVCTTTGLINTTANGGVAVIIGDDSSNREVYHVNGSEDLVGGWRCYPVQFSQTADTTVGTPSSTPDVFGGGIRTTANTGLNNLGIDAIRYGTGIDASGGGSPDPDLTFADVTATNDLTTNQWGVLAEVASGVQLQGELRIGIDDASSPTIWTESNTALLKPNNNPSGVNQKTSSTFSGLKLQGTATTATFDRNVFVSFDVTDRGYIDCSTATNAATVSMTGCTFNKWGTIDGGSGLTFDNNILKDCGVLTVNGSASIDSNTFDSCSPVNAGSDLDLISNCDFISPGSGHAITTSVDTGTLSFVGNSFTGYGADATADAAINFTATTGSVTINVSGGSIPTFLSAGVTVNFQLSTTLTLSGLIGGSLIRIYDTGTTTILAQTDNSSTSFVASISVSAVDIIIFNLGYIAIRLENISTTVDTEIPIEQQIDRQYFNPPGHGGTGTGLTWAIGVDTTLGDADGTFEIRLTDTSGVRYNVNWGDGTSDTEVFGNATHDYTATTGTGAYTITIEENSNNTGVFRPFYNLDGEADKITSIGATVGAFPYGTNLSDAFEGADNLTSIDAAFDVSAVTAFTQTWASCTGLVNFPTALFDSLLAPANNCFVNSWDGCTALSAASVENILNSIDVSGEFAPVSGVDITIDYNTGSGTPTTKPTVGNLQSRDWTVTLNATLEPDQFAAWEIDDNGWYTSAATEEYTETFSQTTNEFGSLGTDADKWGGSVLAPNGKIYAMPYNSSAVLVIDPTNNTTSTFGDVGTATFKYVGGVLAPNGYIYGIPRTDGQVLKIDPSNDTLSQFGALGAGSKWFGGVLAPNGKIYCIPWAAGEILVIDPSNDTTTTFGSFSTDNQWWGGCLAPNGKIYGIPNNSTTVLEIDPSNDTTTTFGSLSSLTNKWAGGVLAPNGKIYGIPYGEDEVLEIDPVAQTATTFGTLAAVGNKWNGGALAPNGKIYGIPRASQNGELLEIDPSGPSVTTFGTLPQADRYYGGTLAPNGKIYAPPRNSSTVLEIGGGGLTLDEDGLLSRYDNKL